MDPTTSSGSEAFLDDVERAAFEYFRQTTNPANGLVADTAREHRPCSIAVAGFALSVYPAAIGRGWVARGEALESSLATLRFFRDCDQRGAPDATGYRGFYYHFLDMRSGKRIWRSELSMNDTAILIAAGSSVCERLQSGTDRRRRQVLDFARLLRSRSGHSGDNDRKPPNAVDLATDAQLPPYRRRTAARGVHGWLAVTGRR
ncbi:MAG: hypothetical protein LT102_05575 [Burkholderiaceae bacterium]|nr:hypothetical protein [Burkholderiaceae bacterium]